MKVYCKNCKWFYHIATGVAFSCNYGNEIFVNGRCDYKYNSSKSGNWYAPNTKRDIFRHPSKINKNNDCKWFEEKI